MTIAWIIVTGDSSRSWAPRMAIPHQLIISLMDLRSKLAVAKRENDDVAGQVRDLELAQGVPVENANMTQAKSGKAPDRM